MSSSGAWRIVYYSKRHEKEIKAQYTSDTRLEKKWHYFVRDVTKKPYYHPVPKRIVKIKGKSYPLGTWRYRHGIMRVIYHFEGQDKKIFPLEVATATKISYKIKSSRRKN